MITAHPVAQVAEPDVDVNVIRRGVVFDASDIEAENSFWAGSCAATLHRYGDWHSVLVGGES
jgi:hypothetical protein